MESHQIPWFQTTNLFTYLIGDGEHDQKHVFWCVLHDEINLDHEWSCLANLPHVEAAESRAISTQYGCESGWHGLYVGRCGK